MVGGGLIGTETALLLRESGREVTVLSRTIGQRLGQEARAAGIATVEAEVGTGTALSTSVRGADAVLCLAGSSTPSVAAADPDGALLGSLSPVLAVLEAARDEGVSRVVIASSGGTVYGAGARTPTREDHPLRPTSLHGVNYQAVEAFADLYRREFGVEVTVLRYSNVYGPGAEPRRGQGVITAWLRALALGRPLVLIGPDSVRRDFVYVSDAAEAAVASLSAPADVYNVGGGESVALADLLAEIEQVTARPLEIERREGRGVDVPVTHLDVGRIAERAGWRPRIGLREGLRRAWEWEMRSGGDARGT